MILKKDSTIVDLKYAERITVEQRSVLIEFSNGKSLVLEYSKPSKEDLLQIIAMKKNDDSYFFELEEGDENEAG